MITVHSSAILTFSCVAHSRQSLVCEFLVVAGEYAFWCKQLNRNIDYQTILFEFARYIPYHP